MGGYLLGIDYGTGGAKACITDTELNVLAYAFREYPIIISKPGWSEHDPVLYWTLTCELIRECLQKAGISPREILGIGTSSALPCLVMVDANHQPINLAYNLMDRRATKEVEWLKEHVGAGRIFALTGNRLEDHPTIVNLLWEKNNRPEAYGRIYKALTIDGFIRLKLTAQATTNYSTAAFYGVAYDIVRNQFDHNLLAEIGIDPALLPDNYPCAAIVGTVTGKAAEETGLVPGIPVAAGQADACAGWVGGGAIEEGDLQMNLGTCGNFGVIHRDTDFMETMIVCPYTVDPEHTYVTIPTTTTGGQLMRYLRDKFSDLERAMEKLTPSLNAYDYLNLEAEGIPPGSEGLLVLPYLMGERTPLWDADARGVVFGLSLSHGKAHLIRAMMESVAYALYHSFTLIKARGKKINYPIVLNEGGAKSKLWRRIITDVFNIPTVLVKQRVGAPYGDAILAGVATGVFADYSIAKEKAEYIEEMEPVKANHERYMEFFELYLKLYQHLKEDFKELAKLRKKYF
ncbi:MAG: FGGY-family carbohydrate kinase [Firmicutes bacterium]|nr:FGGY-family carbohydrate kinase [Bacillota bacterium]